ncbi:MAG TPA: hypothetical protein VFI25_12265 [Planctomycetota bacterium]|nr:hypothetical protein [Planctomycetota bacterium]
MSGTTGTFLFGILSALSLSASGDETEDLRRFLARYRTGSIDASVIGRLIPSLEPPAAFPAYERARDKMRDRPTAEGAALLLEAATLTLAEDPEEELRRFAACQPWVVRRRAIDELRDFYAKEEILEWALRRLADASLPLPERRVLVEFLGAALARAPRAAVYGTLLEALEHPDAKVRGLAAEGLGPALAAPDLMRLLQRLFDEEAAVRLRAARAMQAALPRLGPGLAEKEERRALELLGSRLSEPDPHVRVLLAELLVSFPRPVLTPFLVRALEQEESRSGTPEARLRFRVAVEDLLLRITGLGSPPWPASRWRAWLEKGAAQEMARLPNTRVTSPITRSYPTYFGREVRSDHVVFVMDFSGSMRRPTGTLEHDRGEGRRDPRSRIDVARGEFLGCLRALDETRSFNVVVFAVGSLAAFDDLVPATAENKRRASAFVSEVPLGGSTDLFAGIVRGLRCAGLDAGDRFGTRADTVYLLTDGIPTAGAVTDPGDIARLVTRMNEASGLTLHVVDLGARHGAFQKHLRALAERNGGAYLRPEAAR